MSTYQRLTLIGYLGRDPEERWVQTQKGEQLVAEFSFAVNGYREDETIWFRCSAWGALADVVLDHCHVGKPLYIEGEIRPVNAYLNEDGEPRASLDVMVKTLKFLPGESGEGSGERDDRSSRNSRSRGGNGSRRGNRGGGRRQREEFSYDDVYGDEEEEAPRQRRSRSSGKRNNRSERGERSNNRSRSGRSRRDSHEEETTGGGIDAIPF